MNRAADIPQPSPMASGDVGAGFIRGLALAVVLVVVTVIALAGCATLAEKPPEITTRVDTITVRVPVPIPCVAAAEKPPIPPTNMRPLPKAPATIDETLIVLQQQNGWLLADIDDWRAYGIKADVLLTSCINAATPPKGQP